LKRLIALARGVFLEQARRAPLRYGGLRPPRAVLVAVTAASAAAVPVVRAARVGPILVLRDE